MLAALYRLIRPEMHCPATGKRRSGQWPRVRDAVLEKHPFCAACGGKIALQCHHRLPYHLYPELELSPENLVVLCEAPGHNCHFVLGHGFSWHRYNPDVVEMCQRLAALREGR